MPCGKDGKRDSDTEWRIYDSDDILPVFLTTAADPSHSLRMTINVFLTMTPCECIAICYWLAANSDWLSEFDKSTAYTEQLFLLCFCKDDRQGEGHKYRSVFCIALMTLSGIPVGNDIQGGRWSTDILPGIPFLIIKSIFIHIKISYKCHEGV